MAIVVLYYYTAVQLIPLDVTTVCFPIDTTLDVLAIVMIGGKKL